MKRRRFLTAAVVGGGTLALSGRGQNAPPGKPEGDARSVPSEAMPKRAHELFIPGKMTCSESILIAGCEAIGEDPELGKRFGLGLAAGVGLQGDICGLVSGGALVLAMAVSRKTSDYAERKKKTFQVVGRYQTRFKATMGSNRCRVLTGLDLTTSAGRTELKDRVKREVCAVYVEKAAGLLAEELSRI
ncbi:MAG: C_GCAxxG_C_C family protein [Lentisphaerae bacterium]|nr:C_GCAxxG_C_C family protein [Lentisphaerota bacterium]MBT4819864.1 C_GCAxxG_C_C family protein [Lentisphaerota bacterium]MBT5608139.1 C_GCAxxG_C_C family protein [Lentisphaerota bacterium]MBT7060584.1 C_GCAxxG_C_C family protein [Lentisphaerota bacterium]MBT7847683.1 C_GCAxxG_C_C family protein [Lentisphaerota bacterium]